MHKISVVALDTALPMGITSVTDLFRMAGAIWDKTKGFALAPLFDIEIVAEQASPIDFGGHFRVIPDRAFFQAEDTDLVLIPSTGYKPDDFFRHSPALTRWLRLQHEKGTLIAGGCTGVFPMARSGILDGRHATTHWGHAGLMRERYPDIILEPGKLITRDENLFCSGGGTASMDLCLHLIEKFCGQKTANRLAKIMLLERGRRIQSPFAMFHAQKNHNDKDILRAQEWIETCYDESVQIDSVAAFAGMGLRNFKRRFKKATGDSPLVYIQKLRIEAAKTLLENEPVSIEQVADSVGYEDVGFFRKLFSRHVGTSPSAYRHKFNPRTAWQAHA